MNKLQNCYKKIEAIFNSDIEEFDSVELVDKYRQYWKPETIKTILLAESHVFTTEEHRKIKLKSVALEKQFGLINYPADYAKFVYCLAYGEKNLTNNSDHSMRDGTPQFWKIFYSCVNFITKNQDFQPIQSKTPYSTRIKNKIEILKKMREKGIWLVDTSIVALYNNAKKPKSSKMKEILLTSWAYYIEDVLKQAKPERIIIIGKSVAKTIGEEAKKVSSNCSVISQPNAHLHSKEHLENFQKYYNLCNGN